MILGEILMLKKISTTTTTKKLNTAKWELYVNQFSI